MLRQVLSAVSLSVCLAAFGGCVHSIESDIEIADAPEDDRAYAPVLERSTKARSVFKNFESRYHIVTTYLSPEFRGAFTERMNRVYKTGVDGFEEASAKAGFFVSVYAPSDERTDLSNQQHWSVLMKTPSGVLKPVLVKRLGDKERWRAFFSSVNTWTHEYLIVFDAPGVNPGSTELVEKTAINITFANADGEVNLTW